jgi:ABC-type sugar transport system ATPase subunit
MNAIPETQPILEMEGVSKSYGQTPVLSDVSLTAMAGELTVVFGRPGTGKSVLVRVLTGLEHPDSGRILLRGEDVTAWPPAERNIGYVPQSFALYPHLTVRANIAYPLDLAGVPHHDSRAVVADAAAMLKIEDHLDKMPDQLSGGQKQRVAIARGIAKRTDFFLLDDPLAGLDFKLREQLVDDLRELKSATGASVLYVTSDVVEAMTLADRMAVLSAGTIIEAGVPERLYREPGLVATMALVGFPPANFLRGALRQAGDQTICETTLFQFPVEVESLEATTGRDVFVGIRPERIHLAHGADARNNDDGHRVQFAATVTLREDLGSEDIVYLDAAGTPLTVVDRDHYRGEELDEKVIGAVYLRHLVLFDTASGRALGRGAGRLDAGYATTESGLTVRYG